MEYLIAFFIIGWAANFATTIVSTINDYMRGNIQIHQGVIACMAFSWIPFFVFLAGLKHFIMWAFTKK